MLRNNRALMATFLASITYAFVPILLRYSEGYFSANSVVFNRAWIGAIALALFKTISYFYSLLSTSPSLDDTSTSKDVSISNLSASHLSDSNSSPSSDFSAFNLSQTPLLFALPFFGAQMLWAWSISQTTVASSEVLHSLAPPIAALASWVLFSQAFERQFILGVVLSTLGTITILAGDISSVANFRGDCLALVSAVCYAAHLMASEKLRERWGAIEITLWGFASSALLSAPIVWMTGDTVLTGSWNGWLSIVLCALDASVTCLLIIYALKSISSALAATILLMSPCLTALLSWFLFSETLSWLNICGLGIVLVGIYYSVSGESDTVDGEKTSQEHEEIAPAS